MSPAAQEGFVLVDYPNEQYEAELLEEYRGGLNAFVHISLPDEVLVDIEESKIICEETSRIFYKDDVISEEHGVRIEKHAPEENHYYPGSDPVKFERELEAYHSMKGNLLSFYNQFGLLVDFEPRRGYEDYDKLKRQIQYNIKH